MTLELKNDLKVIGNVQSVDENMNFFLTNMKLADEERNPYMVSFQTSNLYLDLNGICINQYLDIAIK